MLWETSGPDNTPGTLREAVRRAAELGLERFVVASNSGKTVEALLDLGIDAKRVVNVTHQVGFAGPGLDEMTPDTRSGLSARGVQILTTTHFLAGADRALRLKFGGLYPSEIIAASLRLMGQGVKVCVEITVMAADAGLIPMDDDVMAVAGTTSGADTACVIHPAHGRDFFDLFVREIVCKPRR